MGTPSRATMRQTLPRTIRLGTPAACAAAMLLATSALAGEPAKVMTSDEASEANLQGVLTAPLRDVNLLRSDVPDPHRTIGKRTFLHPVNVVFAQFDEDVLPWYGAPQSIYSDHFQWKDGATGPMGFKIEALPLHPALASSLIEGYGAQHAQEMRQLQHTNGLLALLRGKNKKLAETIRTKKALDDKLEGEVKDLLEAYTSTFA